MIKHMILSPDGTVTVKLTPLKAIRKKCLDCCNWSAHEVKMCPAERCPLYPYRFGRDPSLVGKELTKQQREILKKTGFKKRTRDNVA